MKTIKELYNEKVLEKDFSPEPSLSFAEGFEVGAKAMLDNICDWLEEHSNDYLKYHDNGKAIFCIVDGNELVEYLMNLKEDSV